MSEPENPCGNVSTASTSRWEIEKACFVNKKVGEFLTSPAFDALNAKWQIKIYPRGLNEELKNSTSIVMDLLHCVKPVRARIFMSLSENNGNGDRHIGSVGYYQNPGLFTTDCPWQTPNFSPYDKLMVDYKSGDETAKFMISCQFIPVDNMSIPESLGFGNCLNNQKYSDVKFAVEDKNIYAHKIVLANKSKVFAAMFDHQMKENTEGVVNVEDVDYDVLLELLRYIYSGTVNDIEKIAKPLLVAAEKYDLIDLKTHCGAYLGKVLTVDNVRDCLDLAECCDVQLLKQMAVDFVIFNANEIVDTPVFKLIMESHPDVVHEVVRFLSAKRPRLV